MCQATTFGFRGSADGSEEDQPDRNSRCFPAASITHSLWLSPPYLAPSISRITTKSTLTLTFRCGYVQVCLFLQYMLSYGLPSCHGVDSSIAAATPTPRLSRYKVGYSLNRTSTHTGPLDSHSFQSTIVTFYGRPGPFVLSGRFLTSLHSIRFSVSEQECRNAWNPRPFVPRLYNPLRSIRRY